MKKYTLLVFLISLCIGGSIGWYSRLPVSTTLSTNIIQYYTPDNTVIAFDIHKVIFYPDYSAMTRRIMFNFPKLSLIKHLINPLHWYTFIKLLQQAPVFEAFLSTLTHHYPDLADIRIPFIKVINEQCPQEKTIALIAQLNKKRFKLYILSNIGPETLRDLRAQFPTIFSYFSGFYTPHLINNFSRKPQPIFYRQFKHYLQAQGQQNKHIIFIDDKQINIQAASQEGFIGIVYSNPHQLAHELHILGLL